MRQAKQRKRERGWVYYDTTAQQTYQWASGTWATVKTKPGVTGRPGPPGNYMRKHRPRAIVRHGIGRWSRGVAERVRQNAQGWDDTVRGSCYRLQLMHFGHWQGRRVRALRVLYRGRRGTG